MMKLDRKDIHLINRHSNWSENDIDKALKENVYNDLKSWVKFLKILFITLGLSFTLLGLIFFFVYNWNNLDKFIKFVLVEALLITSISVVLFTKINETTKNIILTAAILLIGVSFAIFGQVYQTGADTYDFFLAWTIFATLWVVVSNFASSWLIYIILINATLFLYAEQVADNLSQILLVTLLLAINFVFVSASLLIPIFKKDIKIPIWFTNILALIVVSLSVTGVFLGLFTRSGESINIIILITILSYGLGVKYSLNEKRTFYIGIIFFALIIIISASFVRGIDNIGDAIIVFLILSVFIIVSITVLIRALIKLQKKWSPKTSENDFMEEVKKELK